MLVTNKPPQLLVTAKKLGPFFWKCQIFQHCLFWSPTKLLASIITVVTLFHSIKRAPTKLWLQQKCVPKQIFTIVTNNYRQGERILKKKTDLPLYSDYKLFQFLASVSKRLTPMWTTTTTSHETKFRDQKSAHTSNWIQKIGEQQITWLLNP